MKHLIPGLIVVVGCAAGIATAADTTSNLSEAIEQRVDQAVERANAAAEPAREAAREALERDGGSQTTVLRTDETLQVQSGSGNRQSLTIGEDGKKVVRQSD